MRSMPKPLTTAEFGPPQQQVVTLSIQVPGLRSARLPP
jgi:hypothetical protein